MKMNSDTLGKIEYLRSYPYILEHIKFRSVSGSLDPFIKKNNASYEDGGFKWIESKEDYDFWEKILSMHEENIYLNYYNTVIDRNEYEL